MRQLNKLVAPLRQNEAILNQEVVEFFWWFGREPVGNFGWEFKQNIPFYVIAWNSIASIFILLHDHVKTTIYRHCFYTLISALANENKFVKTSSDT